MFLNVGPNLLESLGARNLGNPHKGLHLRRDTARLHDASGSASSGSFVGHGGGGHRAHHEQVSRSRVRMGENERGPGGGFCC